MLEEATLVAVKFARDYASPSEIIDSIVRCDALEGVNFAKSVVPPFIQGGLPFLDCCFEFEFSFICKS